MMIRHVQITLGAASAGRPLVDMLAARFDYKTRAQWLELIREGRLLLDGAPATPAEIGRAGMVLHFEIPPEVEEPPIDPAYAIVYEDDELLAINKSGNLPCHPSGRYFNHTLWALLKEAGREAIFPINRLDRETSGLVLYGKTREAAAELCRQFAAHAVEKRYAALVEGAFPDELQAQGFLTRDLQSAVKKRRRFIPAEIPPAPDAEPCETHFVCLKRLPEITLIEAIPRTGHCHQIRATLSSLGHPIVGDKLYGIDETCFLRFCHDILTPLDRSRLRLPRQALHARLIVLIHPRTRERLTLEAPLPPDMNRLALAFPPNPASPSTPE